jgi:hypothetical protein
LAGSTTLCLVRPQKALFVVSDFEPLWLGQTTAIYSATLVGIAERVVVKCGHGAKQEVRLGVSVLGCTLCQRECLSSCHYSSYSSLAR